MKSKLNLILLFLSFTFLYVQAQTTPYLEFEDIDQSGIPVTTLFQDNQEQLWVCTQEGMYIYDGITLQKNANWTSPDLRSRCIRCVYKINSEEYYVGSESGIYLFYLKTGSLTLIPQTAGIDVRVIAKFDDNTLWLGTMNGVLKFNTESMHTEKVDEIDSFPVVSIQYNQERRSVYFSNNRGFFEYNLSSQAYTFVPLPIKNGKSYLIHAMAYDKKHNCLWIGAEKVFFKYDIVEGEFEEKQLSSDNTISVITVDSSGNVWVGTDSGICVYNPDMDREELLQDTSQNIKNVIWAIFEDK